MIEINFDPRPPTSIDVTNQQDETTRFETIGSRIFLSKVDGDSSTGLIAIDGSDWPEIVRHVTNMLNGVVNE